MPQESSDRAAAWGSGSTIPVTFTSTGAGQFQTGSSHAEVEGFAECCHLNTSVPPETPVAAWGRK